MSEIAQRFKAITSELNTDRVQVFDELMQINRQRSPRKHVYTRSFNPEQGKITLIPIGDAHLGHANAETQMLQDLIQYIVDTPDCYVIVLGDMLENATRTSVGMGIFTEDIHLRDQIMLATEILEPLAESNRLLGVHTGNHEFRNAILTGLNPMELVATQLGVPYLGYQAYYVINVGSQTYRVMSSHGVGSGRTTGAKANASERMADVAPLMHLYLSGHTHIKHAHEMLKYYVDENNQLCALKQFYVTCGSFMSYFGDYAEMQILPPHTTGVPKIDCYRDTHNMTVLL